MVKHATWGFLVGAAFLAVSGAALADPERYVIDTRGGHAFIQLRIKHLAYSWLYGRFDEFAGDFVYDRDDPKNSRVDVTIRTASLDTNHGERDHHLRGEDFLDAARFPEARFKSSAYAEVGLSKAILKGDLTLRGVTRPITVQVERIGNGPDPWGGYRRGFQGAAELTLADFGIRYNLGPAARKVEIILSIEGVRQ